ncbi:MAG TPA: penicillin acylase family protein [Pararhizobium sp.]|nr:penicillin acylase family protein [Pararhizobium sp.]
MTARRIFRWTVGGAGILVLLIIAAGVACYFWLRTSLPEVDGTISLPGLHASISVDRDKYGVPHITAQDDHDAAFALGFVHAQDRLFEMDLLRRYGEGRISEFAGKGGVPRDRLMRTLGLTRSAQEELGELSAPVRSYLDAYAAGVNAYIAHHGGLKSPYYAFVPSPHTWKPVDTLVIAKVMALYLSQNFHNELEHALIVRQVGDKKLRSLYPAYPDDGFVTLAQLAGIYRHLPLRQLAAAIPRNFSRAEASNNWVVSGARSVTGKPILENDPHLTYMAPSMWYLASVDTPKLHLSGATIPGTPFVVVGHNDHVGWGFTETGGDAEDLFVEQVDPKDSSRYVTPNGTAPFTTRKETIHVKGGKDVTFTVRSTRHGPVISDVADPSLIGGSGGFAGTTSSAHSSDGDAVKGLIKGNGYVLALEATFLRKGDRTAEAFWDIDHARNWQEFRNGLKNWGAPEMNIVYADTGGTIGFLAAGRIPIRKNGDGWLPAPGWTGHQDWTGFVPFNALPQGVDPKSGRFVTANNKIVSDDYPYFITHNWGPPFRATRIAHLLDAQEKQSLDSTGAIAADVKSLMAAELLPLLLPDAGSDQRSQAAVAILRHWNGDMDRTKAAPLIFQAWLRELERELFAKPLGPAFHTYWRPHANLLHRLLTEDSSWCGEKAQAGNCKALVAKSLNTALDHLTKRFGDDMSAWRWGKAHPADFNNPVLGRVPLLGGLMQQEIAASGANETVNAGDVVFSDAKHPFRAVAGPGLRMVLDFSNLSRSRFLMAPGMSGNFLSPHYGDLLAGWRAFHWIEIARTAPAHRLTLRPAPAS